MVFTYMKKDKIVDITLNITLNTSIVDITLNITLNDNIVITLNITLNDNIVDITLNVQFRGNTNLSRDSYCKIQPLSARFIIIHEPRGVSVSYCSVSSLGQNKHVIYVICRNKISNITDFQNGGHQKH